MALVSIIVPVYKAENYLRDCVDSILMQTLSDFELLLVDDGSPDHSHMICNQYAQKDRRVHVIRKENGGAASARNVGIEWALENSNSQWLCFVDSDDWIHPEMLEALYFAAIEQETEISACRYKEVYDREKTEDHTINKENASERYLTEDFFVEYNINAVVPWAKLYKKECFRDLRFPTGTIHEDELLIYKVLFEHRFIALVHEPLYFYYLNSQGVSATIATQLATKAVAFRAYEEQIAFFKARGFGKAYSYRMSSYYIALSALEKQLSIFRMKEFAAKRDIRKRKHSLFLKMSEAEKRSAFNYLYPEMMKNYWRLRKVIDLIRKK